MKKLFLISNAHIDPVWLWEWTEGATATIATFRAAADFCEEFEGYVFCHNEALLYQWTEEYDPVLFKRIQKLVKEKKWHIMGGWFLQSDCNMPSGESIIRQITTGRMYFKEKFDAEPQVAISFDAFGHSRGMVQILKQCGYNGYLFMRPKDFKMDLPARNFVWKGFDGSEILARRIDQTYSNLMGEAAKNAETWVEKETNEEISMLTWGVGNHGGGPSRVDLNALDAWMQERKDIQIRHSTPEEFFEALEREDGDYPVVEKDLRPCFVGCYTSQAKVKQMHRRLENELLAAEKILTAASAMGLLEYPYSELAEAERDLLLNEFHDTLPGTTIESGEAGALLSLSHGLEITARLRMRGFMAMLAGQPKAKPNEVPVFVYNPHPYPVSGVFQCEFMPADQNWSTEVRNTVTVYQDGKKILAQEEKPEYNMNLDWRQRIAFEATLKPFSINRFDCVIEQVPCEKIIEEETKQDCIEFSNDRMYVRINGKTGLVDRYCVDDVPYVKEGCFATVLYEDSADPWKMEATAFTKTKGCFTLVPDRKAPRFSDGKEVNVPAVRVVENGAVRMIVEAEFQWGTSRLIQTYRLPHKGTSFEIEQRIYWNEQDTMAKLQIPCLMEGSYLGQNMFGCGSLPQDGTECVSQKWSGIFGADQALTVTNTGSYGSHCTTDTIYVSLLRAPAYAAHPIPDRRLVHEDRFIARVDQGVHILSFVVCGSPVQERREKIDWEAQLHNEAPFALNAFPGGNGELCDSYLMVNDSRMILSALNRNPQTGEIMVRLWNSSESDCAAEVKIPSEGICQIVELPPLRFQTFAVEENIGLRPVSPLGK